MGCAGRIQYCMALGSKNLADLMTKHMTAELAKQHLTTLNMKLEGGRAESAPTLDSFESFVQGWYEDMEVDAEEEFPGGDRGNKIGGKRSTRATSAMQLQSSILLHTWGREGRKTPPRGTPSAAARGQGVHGNFVDSMSPIEEIGLSACR